MSNRAGGAKIRSVTMAAALLCGALLTLWRPWADAQALDLSGQASGWVTMQREAGQLGLRYMPGLSWSAAMSEAGSISAEAAVNARWSGRIENWNLADGTSAVDPYRLWVRYAAAQFEIRAGLQKISFGSASLLRPLMWFDSIDPRDPLRLTNGVYGLLGRYYFKNNANIWMWGLLGNDDLKGWETLPSDKWETEFGGRAQIPVRAGEMALSYHRRRVDPSESAFGRQHPSQGRFSEDRFGIDGKWDVGMGLWFEATVTYQDIQVPEPRYRRMLAVGADYTFDIGNGPHLLIEQLIRSDADSAFGGGGSYRVSALSIDYPLTILDKIAAIVYYDWERSAWSPLLQWTRTYDAWQVHASVFWNEERNSLPRGAAATPHIAGSGVQLMLVFNH